MHPNSELFREGLARVRAARQGVQGRNGMGYGRKIFRPS